MQRIFPRDDDFSRKSSWDLSSNIDNRNVLEEVKSIRVIQIFNDNEADLALISSSCTCSIETKTIWHCNTYRKRTDRDSYGQESQVFDRQNNYCTRPYWSRWFGESQTWKQIMTTSRNYRIHNLRIHRCQTLRAYCVSWRVLSMISSDVNLSQMKHMMNTRSTLVKVQLHTNPLPRLTVLFAKCDAYG